MITPSHRLPPPVADDSHSREHESPPVSDLPARRRLALTAVVIFVVLGLLALVGFLPRSRQTKQLAADTVELAIPSVRVASPSPGQAFAANLLPAEIKPWIEASLHARANGYLKRWLVDLGATVEAGQLLAEIDVPEIDQESQRAEADLAHATAALELAKITAARWADLVKTASVSDQESAEKQADLALKSAAVDSARAVLRRAHDTQSFGKITAPFAGIITLRRADVGELVSSGDARELFRLAQIDTLRVFVRVPQSMANGLAVGQEAELLLAENRGRSFPAKVARLSGAIDPASRTMLAELEVDNAKREILAGSFAQVRFKELSIGSPLTLPSNTLIFRSDGPHVGLVRPDGKVELRPVALGRDFGPATEILEGVGPADRAILNPIDSLVDGMQVRVVDQAAPSAAN